MDEAKLKRLIRLVEESDIEELEIDRPFGRIRITKKRAEEKPPLTAIREPVVAAAPGPAVVAPPPVEPAVAHPTENSKPAALTIVAPMVGTFYTAPAPGAKPYVSVGDLVKVGQVVCIVEAMKLMNEVQSEVSGKIVKACVESGQAVEYGQELFHVSPS
jgi:acetyl-CoA carboxylase biotin carboxyl carrier protein